MAQAVAIWATAAISLGSQAGQVAAAPPAQGGNNACRVDGQLVVPVVDAVRTYGWAFVANFDHPASETVVTTCLAERTWPQQPWQTKYTVANHCTVMNNTASPPIKFGNGVAPFDGNAYLSCSVPVPGTYPDIFFARARLIPMAAQTYTFLSSSNATVMAQTDAACALTMNSQYTLRLPNGSSTSFPFAHSATVTCGNSIEVGSRVVPASLGGHKIGASFFGPSSGTGRLNIPANYGFNIGAAGQPYTLDWLFIDPTPAKGG
jgi:hypothetical protein